MRILLGVLLCGAVCAAETNIAPTVHLRRSLQLSPAATRLNASPYFKSEIDDFKKLVRHRLTGNYVEMDRDPLVFIGAMHERPEVGEPRTFLWFAAASTDRDNWADIHTNALSIIIDGQHTVTTEPDPSRQVFKTYTSDLDVLEGAYYRINEDVIRLLGSAKRVQVRLVGERRSIQRSLDSTNIARFKVFANTFFDVREERVGAR